MYLIPVSTDLFIKRRDLTTPQYNPALAREKAAVLDVDRATMLSYTLSDVYAIGMGSILVALLSYRLTSFLSRQISWRRLLRFTRLSKLPYVVPRYRHFGPVAIGELILWLVYIGTNIFFAVYRVQSLDAAAQRLALLARINMLALYLGSQLAFAADLVGVGVQHFGKVHLAVGCAVTTEAAVHVVIHVSRQHLSTREPKILFGIVVRGLVAHNRHLSR